MMSARLRVEEHQRGFRLSRADETGVLMLDGSERYVHLTQPVDLMLALVDDPGPIDERRSQELVDFYSPLVAEAQAARRIRQWRKTAAPDFLAAARRGQRGILDARLAPYIERVAIEGEGIVTVGDFPALAAWSFHQFIVRGGRYTLRRCAFCNGWFLGSERATYCRRLAPGSKTQNCQDRAKVLDFRARKQRSKKGGKPHG
jgi:hypothetical protein